MRKSILMLALVVTSVSAVACAGASGTSPEEGNAEQTGSTQQAFGGVLYPVPAPFPTLIPPPPPAPLAPFAFVGGYAGTPGEPGHVDGSWRTKLVKPTHIATTYDGATWVLDEDPANLGETRLRIVFDTANTVNPHVQTILRGAQPWDLNLITGMTVDPQTLDLYVTYSVVNQIFKITLGGEMTLFAGSWGSAWLGNAGTTDGDRLSARFNAPAGIVRGGQGNLYIADQGNASIRIISTAGVVSTLPLTGAPAGFSPRSLARDERNGTLYTTSLGAVYAITSTGQVSRFAGVPSNQWPPLKGVPRFDAPEGLAVDRSGNVYVADTGNHAIKKIVVNWGTTALAVETVSNLSDQPGYRPNDGGYGWPDQTIVSPIGLSFWGDTLLFTDADRHTVRRLF